MRKFSIIRNDRVEVVATIYLKKKKKKVNCTFIIYFGISLNW